MEDRRGTWAEEGRQLYSQTEIVSKFADLQSALDVLDMYEPNRESSSTSSPAPSPTPPATAGPPSSSSSSSARKRDALSERKVILESAHGHSVSDDADG